MTTPPKPSERENEIDAKAKAHGYEWPSHFYMPFKNGWNVGAAAERKKLEEALEIAEKALDEISLMNIRNVKADQKEGRFWDWKDEARHALLRIKALKGTP